MEITGKTFKEQIVANFGPNEFIFPDYDDNFIIYTNETLPVIRRKDSSTRTLNIKIVLNGICMHFKDTPTDYRSKYIDKWKLCQKYSKIDFKYFVFYGYKIKSAFYCNKHRKVYYKSPEDFETTPYCDECFDFVNNPDKYWLNLLPGMIQSKYNGGEYIIPGTTFQVDGFDHITNTVIEFNGCTSHSCKICFDEKKLREHKIKLGDRKFEQWLTRDKFNKTMEKKKKCIEMGYNYIDIFHCTWCDIRNSKEKMLEYKEVQNKIFEKRVKDMIEAKEYELSCDRFFRL